MGAFYRVGFDVKMLSTLVARDDVIFIKGGEICDWFNRSQAA